jgi:hypothetical protein
VSKKHYLELLFFIILITIFLLPSFSKIPFGILEDEGCDCTKSCEYNLGCDVDYVDLFITVPNNLDLDNYLCNVRTAIKVFDDDFTYIDEISLITYRPSPAEHSYTHPYWARQVTLDRSIDQDVAKAMTEDNIKFVMKLCYYDNECEYPKERIWKPLDYGGLNFDDVRLGDNNHLQVFVTVKEIWNTGKCEECCE